MRPCTVTRRSCIASSSAACVFGGVRLISSASSTLANTGPGMKISRRWPVSGSSWMTSVPVTSDGMRSGVNWMRENLRSSARDSVEMSSVLARPGTPTSRQLPPANSAISACSTTASLPTMTLRSSVRDASARLGEAVGELGVVETVEVGGNGGGGGGQAVSS